MPVLYLDILDPQVYGILEQAMELEEISGVVFEVVPISNGSILSYLPLLAFAWLKRESIDNDCLLLHSLLKTSIGTSEFWLSRVVGIMKIYGGGEDSRLAEQLLCIDNVRSLTNLLARSELLEIKALTMTQSNGRVYIGYAEVQGFMSQYLDKDRPWSFRARIP